MVYPLTPPSRTQTEPSPPSATHDAKPGAGNRPMEACRLFRLRAAEGTTRSGNLHGSAVSSVTTAGLSGPSAFGCGRSKRSLQTQRSSAARLSPAVSVVLHGRCEGIGSSNAAVRIGMLEPPPRESSALATIRVEAVRGLVVEECILSTSSRRSATDTRYGGALVVVSLP